MANENEGKKPVEVLSEEQLGWLAIPPPEEAYRRRMDDKLYLPIGYYRQTADRIFGVGNWGLTCDHSTLRFEVQNHPVTREPIGALCSISTTLTVRDCLPITITGHAPVQFLNNLAAYQNISIYDLAVRAAEARGLKKAFAYYGAAFICASSEEEIRRQNAAVKQSSAYSSGGATPGATSSHLTLVSANSANGVQEPLASETANEDGKAVKPGRGRAERSGASAASSDAEVRENQTTVGTDERIAGAEAVLAQPAPWDEVVPQSVSVMDAPNEVQAETEGEAEAQQEERLSNEQQTKIERLVKAKGYPLSAADGTAQKLYGAKVADLTVEQAKGLIGKLERLKARAA